MTGGLTTNELVSIIVSRCLNKCDMSNAQLSGLLEYGSLVIIDNNNKVNLTHFIENVTEINTSGRITIRVPLDILRGNL